MIHVQHVLYNYTVYNILTYNTDYTISSIKYQNYSITVRAAHGIELHLTAMDYLLCLQVHVWTLKKIKYSEIVDQYK